MSPLLSLSAEMRNSIIGFALYESGGLHYRSDLGGIDRLYASLDLVTKKMRHLYEFEANQLKYVCRQLYHETKGRVLELNTLTFTRVGRLHPCPLHQVKDFFATVSERRTQLLSCINLKIVPELERERWASAARCCVAPAPHITHHFYNCARTIDYLRDIDVVMFARRHPHIMFNVDITLPPYGSVNPIPSTYVVLREIATHLIVFRGMCQEMTNRFMISPRRVEQKKLLRFGSAVEVLNVPNVHFRLPQSWANVETMFKTWKWPECFCMACLGWVFRYFEGGMKGLEECFEGWARDGF